MKAKPIKKPKTVKSNPVEPKKPTGISSKETKERVDNSQTIQEIPPSPIVMGRPRKYDTVKGLQNLIQEYFDSLFEYKPVTKKEPIGFKKDGTVIYKRWIEKDWFMVGTPSLTGLQAHCGITKNGRSTWKDYKDGKYDTKENDFSHTIYEATSYMEKLTEEGGLNGKLNPMIVKFTLENNYGWENKIKNELTANPFEGVSINIKKKK